MLHVVEFIATFTAAIFAGAALYVNLVEHPARMALDTKSAVLEWAPSYRRATRMQAPLALVSLVAGLASWWIGGGVVWAIAALLIGAALLLGGAAGLAYKVISGYRHPSPDAFFSVQDKNSLPAASAADRSTPAPTVPVDVPAPQQVAASVAQTLPITAAPPAVQANSVGSVPSASAAAANPTGKQDSSECAPIKSEQHEIRGALNKKYSPEVGRYMQRRLHELADQLVSFKCAQ
jgi:hypothetical protein